MSLSIPYSPEVIELKWNVRKTLAPLYALLPDRLTGPNL